MEKQKKLKIVFAVMLAFNAAFSLLSFVIIPLLVCLGFISMALMWAALLVDFALWGGSAVTANVIAGFDPQKKWYSVLSPFFTVSLPIVFATEGSNIYDLPIISVIILITCALVGLVPFLITIAARRKKERRGTSIILKENNETI